MAESRILEMLGSTPLFDGLSPKELKMVAEIGKEVTFEPGREMVKQGATGVGFHLLVEGEAAVLVADEEVARLRAGDYFGEMSLIDGGPRSATVRAESPVRTFSLPVWDFTGLLDGNPSIGRKLLLEMTRRLRAAGESHTH